MLKIGVLGANGYTGYELVKLLLQHKEAQICYLGSRAFKGVSYENVYPQLCSLLDLKCEDKAPDEIAPELDLIFSATPQGFAASVMSENLLKDCKFIDLSADFRLKDFEIYEKWYHLKHCGKAFLKDAVYGLCELHRAEIQKASLIANPGCYTTASILALAPLMQSKIIDKSSIIIDAKSGVSGAGRGEKLENLFCEVNENFKPYAIASHRHTPEIEQELSLLARQDIILQFTPHLVPMQRGIVASIYVNLEQDCTEEQIKELYENFYKNEFFVRILRDKIIPQTRFVRGTNFVDINIFKDERTNRLIIISALDNLIKGAVGQAVQNMNLLFGFDEKMGLEHLVGGI